MIPATLRVLCEGQTEQNFVAQVLGPHLKEFQVFAKPEFLIPRRGGIVPFDTLRRAIKRDLGRSRSHEYLTTMIDLYGLGSYPGSDKQPAETVAVRVARIEAEMAEQLPNPRFIPYIQVHEFEALVLVDLNQIPSQFPDGEAKGAPERLRMSIGNTPPEDVDDGAQTAPSKRIIREVPAYAHLKHIAGPIIAAEIGLPRLRGACPRFDAWVRRLEQLGEDL